MSAHNKPLEAVITKLNGPAVKQRRHSKTQSAFNYDNTSSNVAATTMRNELNKLVDTAPPEAKEVNPTRTPPLRIVTAIVMLISHCTEIQTRYGQFLCFVSTIS